MEKNVQSSKKENSIQIKCGLDTDSSQSGTENHVN